VWGNHDGEDGTKPGRYHYGAIGEAQMDGKAKRTQRGRFVNRKKGSGEPNEQSPWKENWTGHERGEKAPKKNNSRRKKRGKAKGKGSAKNETEWGGRGAGGLTH